MAKPVVLTVDDDPEVLQAVSRDLRHQYGDRFRVVRAESGIAALDSFSNSSCGMSPLLYFWSINGCLKWEV
ncbi:MAG TPA: hypothetical protein V6D30_00370 [Leptolyngbyaceae cyanobacterium]